MRSRIRYEYELKKLLEEEGFTAIRLPASGKSYHYDLVAFKFPCLYFIEVKTTSTGKVKLTEEQRKWIEEEPSEFTCKVIMVREISNERKPLKEKWRIWLMRCNCPSFSCDCKDIEPFPF